MPMFVDLPYKCSIRGNRLVIRKAFEELGTKKKKTAAQLSNEKNLSNNCPSGFISRKIKMNMQKIIANFIHALKFTPIDEQGYKLFYPTFVTLTLPSEQMHSDKECNAKLLNPFIATLKRKFDVRQYVWRAEKQDNGNIHYHVIIDKYIHHSKVREEWNNQLAHLGYINNYRINQQLQHKNGFTPQQHLFEKWSLEKQFEAYNKGIVENWSNPNSTDIHSLINIKNVESYICKYATKSEEHDQLNKLQKQVDSNEITQEAFEISNKALLLLIEKKKINARLWGCSDELRVLKDCSLIIDSLTDNFINEVKCDTSSKVVTDENYTIIYNNSIADLIQKHKQVNSNYKQHHLNNFYHLYNEFAPPPKSNIQPLLIKETEKSTLTEEQLCLFD